MRTFALAILLWTAAQPAAGATPGIYEHITHVVWVVQHLDGPLEGWSKLGLTDVHQYGRVRYQGSYHGRAHSGQMRMASGRLGNLAVDMVEPEGNESAFADFLGTHGDGIFAIAYSADQEEMTKEAGRLNHLDVPVLERMRIETDRGPANFTFFDTQKEGKYVLGLVDWSGGAAPGTAAAISHIAFVIREAQPVSDYWQRVGFPAMRVDHASPRADSRYHGQPLTLSFDVGWHDYSHPTFEWIIPPAEPANCYADYLKTHGEGIHHVGVPVDDLEKAVGEYKQLGYGVVQSGAWGDVGKPKSGQYDYMDTDSIGGVTVELIHAYR